MGGCLSSAPDTRSVALAQWCSLLNAGDSRLNAEHIFPRASFMDRQFQVCLQHWLGVPTFLGVGEMLSLPLSCGPL